LWHYTTSREASGLRPDEAVLGPGVYSVSNRNEYQKQTNFLGSIGRPARKADNLTAICEPIVCRMWDPQHLTAP
jgi:hypothetical protein